MVGFAERWRVRALVVVVIALVGTWWVWRRAEHARSDPGRLVRSAGVSAVIARDQQRSPCLEPRPTSGIYALDDGSIRVAVVDGCVAAHVTQSEPIFGLLQVGPAVDGSIAVPHVPARLRIAEANRREVVLVPDTDHAAIGGDGTILRVVSDRSLAVFQRFGRDPRSTRARERQLALISSLDDRGPRAVVGLLAHHDVAVQMAAVTRLLHARLDDSTCAALRDWLVDAYRDEPRRTISALVFYSATDRCLVPAIRHAIDEPLLVGAASDALARLGTPAEKAEALLAILDARLEDSRFHAVAELSKYLHPDHCGIDRRELCLSTAAAADYEQALRQRLDLREPKSAALVLYALRAYLGPERHAVLALELAATAPCRSVELLMSTIHARHIPAERVELAFASLLDRRTCEVGRYWAALTLAHRVEDSPEAHWALLASYLDAARVSDERRLSIASVLGRYGCYPRTRDVHPTADAVLARVDLRRCQTP